MRRDRARAATDRQLAEALLLQGDERAFRELYRRHTPRLFQFVLRLLGGVENDAEDIVQETWIRATQKLEGFRWESNLSTWLGGIGLNLCRDLWRRRNGRELEFELAAEPVQPGIAHAERIDLERAIARLPSGYRTVLILHDLEGCTHEEIGRRLGIAAGTSKSQLSSARRAVRTLLQPEE
jgi:RNA polymerase sigma-70 factor (ECF subfamily)